MIEHKFTRKGKTITTHSADGDQSETFPSVNKARRQSRVLQQANGGLGRGSLVLVK